MRSIFGFKLLLVFYLFGSGTSPVQAQATSGIVRFANDSVSGINAPFFEADGSTRLSGPNYRAALYAGSIGSLPETWIRVSGAQPFRTDSFAGFWESANVVLPGISPGSFVSLQVRFWDSGGGAFETYEHAVANGAAVGVSRAITVMLNGGFPPVPTAMTGLQSASLVPTMTLTRGLPGIVTGSTSSANGMQLANLCATPVGTNRWFRVASSFAGDAIVTTTGSSIDTVMTAFEGSIVSPGAMIPIACNDDRAPGLTASEVQFPVEANKLYLICVAGKNGAFGTIQLNHTLTTPLAILPREPGWIELSWPADATNFLAETTSDARTSTDWTAITNPPATITNRLVLRLNCLLSNQVYRLRLRDTP